MAAHAGTVRQGGVEDRECAIVSPGESTVLRITCSAMSIPKNVGREESPAISVALLCQILFSLCAKTFKFALRA